MLPTMLYAVDDAAHTDNAAVAAMKTQRTQRAPRTALRALLAVTVCVFQAAIARTPSAPRKNVPILLFAGAGTSVNDVAAFETILKNHQLQYTTAFTQQLNAMSESQLSAYRLLIVPGGNYIVMSESLLSSTMTNVHNAVHSGLNYVGVCAGAFLAGHGTYKNFDLTSGVKFNFYSAELQNIRKTVVPISRLDMKPVEHYWEDGPELSGWGEVVGKYPDGTPAIVEGPSGKGWVILVGTHPEAPDLWRRGMAFTMPASAANEVAGELLEAGLKGVRLVHF